MKAIIPFLFSLWLIAPSAHAQSLGLGFEVADRVSDYAVAADPDGGFAVGWIDPDTRRVLLSIYSPSGESTGEPIVVETGAASLGVAAASIGNGRYAVGWIRLRSNGSTAVARLVGRSAASRTILLGEGALSLRLAGTGRGDWLAGLGGAGLLKLQTRDGSGRLLGRALVSDVPNAFAVGADASGRYVVTYRAARNTQFLGLFARTYDRLARPVTSFLVSAQDGRSPGLSLGVSPAGSFAVAWSTSSTILVQRYLSTGQPTGARLTLDIGHDPAMAMNASGQSLVTTSRFVPTTEVIGQVIPGGRGRAEPAFHIADGNSPVVAGLGRHRFVVLWSRALPDAGLSGRIVDIE